MRVRPLIDCIMSEIEPFFLFSDLGINIDSINHYLSVLPVFISESVWSLYVFSILSGIDCSESFRISHLHDSVTCLYISIIHYLGLFIYVHMLVSRLKSDCDCYFSCTFYTFTT